MQHSEQKCAHFCSEWCILGYGTGAFWDLWIRSILNINVEHQMSQNKRESNKYTGIFFLQSILQPHFHQHQHCLTHHIHNGCPQIQAHNRTGIRPNTPYILPHFDRGSTGTQGWLHEWVKKWEKEEMRKGGCNLSIATLFTKRDHLNQHWY